MLSAVKIDIISIRCPFGVVIYHAVTIPVSMRCPRRPCGVHPVRVLQLPVVFCFQSFLGVKQG